MRTSSDDHRKGTAADPAGADATLARHMEARRALSVHLTDAACDLMASARRLAGRAPMADLEAELKLVDQQLAELEHKRFHYAGLMRVR